MEPALSSVFCTRGFCCLCKPCSPRHMRRLPFFNPLFPASWPLPVLPAPSSGTPSLLMHPVCSWFRLDVSPVSCVNPPALSPRQLWVPPLLHEPGAQSLPRSDLPCAAISSFVSNSISSRAGIHRTWLPPPPPPCPAPACQAVGTQEMALAQSP